MQQLKIERNEDGTYTVNIDGKIYTFDDDSQLAEFLKDNDI